MRLKIGVNLLENASNSGKFNLEFDGCTPAGSFSRNLVGFSKGTALMAYLGFFGLSGFRFKT